MHTGMSDMNRQLVAEGLSRWLADVYATYLKTQNFHWNLHCSEFYYLHLLFEKQYQEMAEETDEIAERIRALGFYVDATFSGFKNLTTIKDTDKVLGGKEMIEHLLAAHEAIARHGRNLSKVAENENDPGTVDLVGRRVRDHEKMAWMLRASL